MPKEKKITKCAVCHENTGLYVRVMIDGMQHWVCTKKCLKLIMED